MLPSIAIISFSPLHEDARVQRQIRTLTSMCRVTALGWTDPCIEGVRFVDVSQRRRTRLETAIMACRLKAKRFETVYRSQQSVRRVAEALRDHDYALIVANDLYALPVALTCRGSAKVLFDAHEYSPRQFESWFLWRFFIQEYKTYLCRTRLIQADAIVTISERFSEEYEREFSVRPSVVMNAPHYQAGLYTRHEGELIRMVHHGGAISRRRLETVIDAMMHLDERFRLDLRLVPVEPAYLAQLRKRASADSRISILPPVSPDEIVGMLSSYDVGLCTYAAHSFNALYSLPNKFFEFIQARLCTVAAPLPEVTRLIETYDCGFISREFSAQALAETLRTLDREKVEACRRAADVAATDLCYERSAEVLLAVARRLLGLAEQERARREDAGGTG